MLNTAGKAILRHPRSVKSDFLSVANRNLTLVFPHTMKTASAVVTVCFLGLGVNSLRAIPYNLAADWSDTSNPNGVWSYLVNGAVPPSGIRGGDVFGVPTPIWGTSSFEGWSRSNGDVFGHTLNNGDPMQIRWTSPTAGFIDVTGAVWGARDILRYNNWSISLNGIPLYLGVVGSGDPYSRSSPRSILLPSRHSGQYRHASKAEQKESSRSHRRPARGLGSVAPYGQARCNHHTGARC